MYLSLQMISFHWLMILLFQAHSVTLTVFATSENSLTSEPYSFPLDGRITPMAPSITEQPSSRLAKTTHTTIRLNCRADGYPKPIITWLKDGVELDKIYNIGKAVARTPTGELIFIRLLSKGEGANTGTYQCIATNNLGSVASRNVTVNVASIKNNFRIRPVDKWAPLGAAATLECRGPKGIPEPDISWKKNNRELKTNSRMQIKPDGNLVITRLMKSDSGTYRCVATNMAGRKTSNGAVLRVQKPPNFVSRPSNTAVLGGSTVELECVATGDPLPRIKWSRTSGSMSERQVSVSNGNLRITGIQPEDQGEYMCTAENKVGKETATAFVTVEVKPVIMNMDRNPSARVGETVNLSCTAKGVPPPTVFWRDQYGVDMFTGRSYRDGHVMVAMDGTLTIFSAKFDDEGVYQCHALNPVGSVTAKVQLSVQAGRGNFVPPVIKRTPSNRTIGIGGVVLFECTSSSVPQPEISWLKKENSLGTGSNRHSKTALGSLKIQNVQISDAGRYTCQVENSHGFATWDAWLTVAGDGRDNTLSINQSLSETPSKPMMINSTSHDITLSWNPHLSVGNTVSQLYILEYYRIGGSTSTWQRMENLAETTYTLRHLTPSTDYVFIVRRVNPSGISHPSLMSQTMKTKDRIFSDPSRIPGSSSLELQLVLVTLIEAIPVVTADSARGSLILRWETNNGCDVIDGYVIVAQPVAASSKEEIAHAVSCDARTYTLDEVMTSAKYEVRIRPYKGHMTGKPSRIVFLSLQDGMVRATAPTLTTKFTGEHKATFLWQPPRDLPAIYVTGYILRCRSRDDDSYDRTVRVNSSVTELTLSDLRDDVTNYVATVTYLTKLGNGLSSSELQFTLGVTSSGVSGNTDGFVGVIQSQPIVIAGVASAIVLALIIIVGGTCYYKRSKRSYKTRGFHVLSFNFAPYPGFGRSFGGGRFDGNAQYSADFHITPTSRGPIAQRQTTDLNDFGLLGQGGPNNTSYLQHTSLSNGRINNNSHKSVVLTYNTENSMVASCLNEEMIDAAHLTKPGFSYVADQLTSMNDIPPHFTSSIKRPTTALSQLTTAQHLHYHQEQLSRQLSTNSSTHGRQYPPDMFSSLSNSTFRSDLPPPPSSPISQHTAINNRSHSSIAMNSNGNCSSSRSSQQISRGASSGNQLHNTAHTAYFPDNLDICMESTQQNMSRHVGENVDNSLPPPPTPPVRGTCHAHRIPILQFDPARDSAMNLGFLTGSCVGDFEKDTDKLERNPAKTRIPEHDSRISAVSMVNVYDPELDEEGYSCERDSTASLSSDEGSLRMDSVSQVGRQLLKDDETFDNDSCIYRESSSAETSLLHTSPRLTMGANGTQMESGLLSDKNSLSVNSKRVNNSSNSPSLQDYICADSGMSVTVSCSTEQSSLQSNTTVGSVENRKHQGSKLNRSKTADSVVSYTGDGRKGTAPSALDISTLLDKSRINADAVFTPDSSNASGLSEHSGYVSTTSSCWNFHSSPPTNQSLMTPHRSLCSSASDQSSPNVFQVSHSFQDGQVPSINHNTHLQPSSFDLKHSDLKQSYIGHDDVTPTDLNDGYSGSGFEVARAVFSSNFDEKLGCSRRQKLSDVFEVSTSDFCEDYSDQSN